MIINAKFSSLCGLCRKAIAIGSKVEWAPGSRAAHVACATPTRATRTPRATWRQGCGYPGCGGGAHCDECSE